MSFQLTRKSGFGVLMKEQGIRGFFRGSMSTLLGYSAQGACKFGFYELFNKYYSDIADLEYVVIYKTLISAFAQLIADVSLCPFKAIKVRVQHPGFAHGFSYGFPSFSSLKALQGMIVQGISPALEQPYFRAFVGRYNDEVCLVRTIVELMYKYAISTPKVQCSKSLQLGVSFDGGYVAGFFVLSSDTLQITWFLSLTMQ
ncbi:Mitochondrial phosphate carrier protein 3 mitochondrial, partial [Bienertia sinuspersici]